MLYNVDNLELSLVNVLDSPVASAELTYTIFNKGALSAPKGPVALKPGANTIALNEELLEGPTFEINLTIKHEQYAKTSFSLRIFNPKFMRWNNRNAVCSLVNKNLIIKLLLIRLRQAPVCVISKGLKKSVDANPDKSVLPFLKAEGLSEGPLSQGIWNDPDATAQQYWGLETYDQAQTIRTIKNEADVPIKTADAEGWDRFFFEDTSVKLSDSGGFLWLEYGAVDNTMKTQPRFLIGLWVPKKEGEKPLDFIVNFAHSPVAWKIPKDSFPYRKDYPYSINKADVFNPGHPQPYINLGLAYFFQTPNFSFHFAAQSVPSKKPVIIVTPILPMDFDGKLGQPFTNQQGIFRLILEIKAFLYQKGYSEAAGINFQDWQGKTASTALFENPLAVEKMWLETPPKELKIGNIVVCAHSSGLQFLLALIQTKQLPKSTNFPFDLYGSKESEFESAWKEIWDLDIAHKDSTPIDVYLTAVLQWYKRGNRVLRLYRSQQTFSSMSDFDDISVLKPMKVNMAKGAASGSYWHNAKEDLSLLFMNNGFASTTKAFPGILPAFLPPGQEWWRYHQAPMIIGFGHACKMRISS